MNFGTGDARSSFAAYDKLRPDGVHFTSEYRGCWFDHRGGKHETRSTATQLDELGWMLGKGYSVNLYMFNGGTSFGRMNGANSDGANDEPDVTSYGADSRDGRTACEIFRAPAADREAHGQDTAPLPEALPKPIETGPIRLDAGASLWSNLPQPAHGAQPVSLPRNRDTEVHAACVLDQDVEPRVRLGGAAAKRGLAQPSVDRALESAVQVHHRVVVHRRQH